MHGCRVTFGATVGVAEVTSPFRYDFRYPEIANVIHKSRWRRWVSSRAGESTLRLLGAEWGWERPPSDPRIYGPDTRSRATTSATGRGSLPARACGATNPCGKASGPAEAGPGRGRRRLRRRRGPRWRAEAGRQRADATRGLVGLPPALWSRRASAAWSKATRSAGVRSAATTAVRRCSVRARCGGSGAVPPTVRCFRQRRERARVRRGAQPPLASPSVYTLGMLALVP